jgi:predicted component of type VI protein secretion system
MKFLKRFLRIFLILFVAILLFLFAAPFLFQDKIKEVIRTDLNNMLNAEVFFEDIGLSFFKNFPNACISLQEFGLVNKAPFDGDTLVSARSFELVADVMSVISGDEIRLKRLNLLQPRMLVHVLEDGTASYDIMKPDTAATEVVADTAPPSQMSLNIGLQRYSIEDAFIIYKDATMPMSVEVSGFNHEGSGDFTETNFDLRTRTQSDKVTVVYDGITYLNDGELQADMDMNIDIAKELIVKLLDNNIRVNALQMAVDGQLDMPGDDINMDFTFKSPQTDFGSLFSLFPGVYTEDFGDIKTAGNLLLEGYVKGTYNDTEMPGFGLDVNVEDGNVQYPDLPEPLSNIQLDMHIHEPDGTFEKMLIDVRKFHTDLGNNPIDAAVQVEGLDRMKISGKMNADVKLDELSQMVPLEGNTLRGLFKIDAQADGVYDEANGTFPKVDAIMSLKEGYVKNEEYNAEISDFHFNATLSDADQDLTHARFEVPDFHFVMDGEPIDGSVNVVNFDDPQYNLKARGKLDLEKVMQIYPIEGMELSGKLTIEDFETSGKLSDVEAERYTELPTSGQVKIENLRYYDAEVGPQVTVAQGSARFTPERLQISSANGMLGESDYAVSGFFDNYIAYALLEDQPISGTLNMQSKRFNTNEWLEEEDTPVDTEAGEGQAEEVPMEVFPIPANMDIKVNASFDEVLYENYTIKDLKGKLAMADERLNMDEVNFKLLGSPMNMSGFYDTKNVKQPDYGFLMDIQNLNMAKAYENFSTLSTYAPVTKLIDGNANTTFAISGKLNEKMMPILETVTSEGFFQFLTAKMEGNKLFDRVASLTKMDDLKKVDLSEMKGWYEIANGNLEVKPFRLESQGISMTMGGEQSLSGNMDYQLALAFPQNKASSAATNALSQLTGASLDTGDSVRVNLSIGGTLTDPKITSVQSQTTDDLKGQLASEAEKKLKEETGLDINVDSLGQQARDAKTQAVDSAKAVIDNAKQAAADSAQAVLEREKQKAKEKAKEELEKELEKQLGDEAKEKLDELKNKLKFPKRKKKN